METMSHTPGPWEVCIRYEPNDWPVYAINGQMESHEEEQANARLIAAAPDLLAALKHAEKFCPCGARPESPHTHPHVIGCPVGAAIAKAEGR